MAKCEQFINNGTCYPGIDKVKPIEHTEHFAQGDNDSVPFAWKLTDEDSNYEKEDEYWVCEDCHVALLMKQLAAGQNMGDPEDAGKKGA